MTQSDNSNKRYTEEAVFTLKRTITFQNKKNIGVSRSFYVGNKRIYSDNISRELWFNSLENPDIFGLVEQFSMGNDLLNVRKHTTRRAKYRKHFVKLFDAIRRKFTFH